MSYLVQVGSLIVAILTLIGALSRLISKVLDQKIDNRIDRWHDDPAGERTIFSINDRWVKSRGRDWVPDKPDRYGRRKEHD